MNYYVFCRGCPQSVCRLPGKGMEVTTADPVTSSAPEDKTPAFNHSWLRHGNKISQEKIPLASCSFLVGMRKPWSADSQIKYSLTDLTSLMSRGCYWPSLRGSKGGRGGGFFLLQ